MTALILPRTALALLIGTALCPWAQPGGHPAPAGAQLRPFGQFTTARSELWVYPAGSRDSVLDGFRRPPTPYTAGHRGIDLPAGPGLPIFAPATGTVSFVGVVADRPLVSVRVSDDLVYSIEPATSAYAVGETVARGAPFATAARGGHCADGCVHLGVRLGAGGTERYVDPMRFFAPKPVLLPW